MINNKNYNYYTTYTWLCILRTLAYYVVISCVLLVGFFFCGQRTHFRGELSKALMVFSPSSACWESFSLAGGPPGTLQEPEVSDSWAETVAIEPLAIDLCQWYITAKYSWMVGVLHYSTVKTLITWWNKLFYEPNCLIHWQKSKSNVWANPSLCKFPVTRDVQRLRSLHKFWTIRAKASSTETWARCSGTQIKSAKWYCC